MKTWTVAQMLAEKPCSKYTEEVLTKLWAGRKKVTLLDILDMDIPDKDKMWGAWKGLTKKQTVAVLDRIVTRAVTNYALNCGVPEVQQWAADWLSGKDRSTEAARTARAAWAAEAARAAWAARAAGAAEAAWAARAAGAAAEAAWAAEAARAA